MVNQSNADESRARLLGDADALVAYLRASLPRSRAAPGSAEERLRQTINPGEPGSEQMATLLNERMAHVREAAVLAPIYARDGAPWLIFTVRSLDLSSHRGEISFPGGSREAADATLSRTALREAREEIGLDPEPVAILGPLPPVFSAVSNFLIQPYVGWLGEGVPRLTPNPAEVSEVIHAPLAALDDPTIYHTELWSRGGVEHLVHFYDFGAYRIWGATGRMLNTLLEVLPA
ncbi:MAG TPA: CoA pyrophosphatase [Ktedonobacterales bacterium]|nr:CoA pyrophosphatase [Ktedonobacterales bacterium]